MDPPLLPSSTIPRAAKKTHLHFRRNDDRSSDFSQIGGLAVDINSPFHVGAAGVMRRLRHRETTQVRLRYGSVVVARDLSISLQYVRLLPLFS